jgi:hypothetical protein
MSIEKELTKYASIVQAKEKINQPLDDRPILENNFLYGGEDYTYINVSLLMRKDLLEDINLMSEELELNPNYTLSIVLHELVTNGLMLTPIEPICTLDDNGDELESNIEIDAHYLLHDIGDGYDN